MEAIVKTDLEKAQQLIVDEKNARCQAFNQELEALCKKYNCTIGLEPARIIIQAL